MLFFFQLINISFENPQVYDSIIDLSSWDGCSETPPSADDISDKFVITSNGNCSIIKKADTIKVSKKSRIPMLMYAY